MTSLTPSKLRLSAVLMISTLLLIAGFQVYWIKRLYGEERDGLQRTADVAFRDVMYKLQMERFRKDSFFFKTNIPENLFVFNLLDSVKNSMADSLLQKEILPGSHRQVMITVRSDIQHDSFVYRTDTIIRRLASLPGKPGLASRPLNAPLDLRQVDSAYGKELLKSHIDIPYTLNRVEQQDTGTGPVKGELKTNVLSVGLSGANAYQAILENPVRYILGQLRIPILVGFFLLGFTTLTFVFIYRNLVEQRRLSEIKNDFIGNITHELKTPIATVSVAVEALRAFNALEDPVRTKEYLDISALELRRLSMLVGKVLRLSLLENRAVDLAMETTDLYLLTEEVMAGFTLQARKAGARIRLTQEGIGFGVHADPFHMTSVLINLLDNALKYGGETPEIDVHLAREGSWVNLTVSDNGMGIPPAYTQKIFEKFFRIPSGDHHNIKGHGLGLSYVRQIVSGHGGTIGVDSREGRGSTFVIQLPAV